MFDICCAKTTSIDYSLKHSPIPFNYGRSIDDAIKVFLLYMPNIDSAQSFSVADLDDFLYDDFFFSYVMKAMEINEDTDVKWYKSNEQIPNTEWEIYHDSLCIHCQKIIVCRYANQTKIKNLLRCIRNCIAHGDFAIVNDYLIGFNQDRGKNKAVIKIKYNLLLNTLKSLLSPAREGMIKEELIAYALNKVGYEVSRGQNICCDMIAIKNNIEYYIEIKLYKGTRFLYNEHIMQYVLKSDNFEQNKMFVLLIDTSKVTKEVKKLMEEHPKFKLIDIDNVKELLQGSDVLEQQNY